MFLLPGDNHSQKDKFSLSKELLGKVHETRPPCFQVEKPKMKMGFSCLMWVTMKIIFSNLPTDLLNGWVRFLILSLTFILVSEIFLISVHKIN